jgi:Fe-S cluster assembly protein SufB
METKMSAPTTTTGISDEVRELANQEYQYGFVTELETEVAPRGLNEDIIRLISTKKNEPDWLLEWRLKAYRHWTTLTPPTWQHVSGHYLLRRSAAEEASVEHG